jgi:hypothetical protein
MFNHGKDVGSKYFVFVEYNVSLTIIRISISFCHLRLQCFIYQMLIQLNHMQYCLYMLQFYQFPNFGLILYRCAKFKLPEEWSSLLSLSLLTRQVYTPYYLRSNCHNFWFDYALVVTFGRKKTCIMLEIH